MPTLWLISLAVFALNLPFGFWRAGQKKFTLGWFLAVHLPVPLVYAMRVAADLPFQLSTLVVLVSAFFAGQYVGAKLRLWRKPCA